MTQKVDVSIIVVTLSDNETEIPSIRKLREYGADFELVIRQDKGICKARNRGIQKATHDKIVFIDDDAIPEPGYIEAASRALEHHPVVVGAVEHPYDDVYQELCPHYRDPNRLVGCNMGFRREVFETVGGFDEGFQWGHDETELQDRIEQEFELYYEPEMAVKHAYAENFKDYLKKMWVFGPADIYYAKKGTADGNIWNVIGLDAFKSETFKGTVVKTAGRIVRNISILKALLNQK